AKAHWGMYDFCIQKTVSQYRCAYRSSLSPESGERCPQDGMRDGTSKPPISQTSPIHTPMSIAKGTGWDGVGRSVRKPYNAGRNSDRVWRIFVYKEKPIRHV
ncbi:MAG: hypothetical protein NT023_20895, partial [Armatimonadetes bacterium]|nr:hypothetical protein [Armatimonadota bacterium]